MIKDVFLLREWMPFSDQEISIFQFYFLDYLIENESKLSKVDCFSLASLASDTQYQIRLLKARIIGDSIDEESNNKYIKLLLSYKGLVDFVVKKIIEDYDSTSLETKYQLSSNSYYSYFTATDAIRDSIKQDFDLYWSNNLKINIL